MAKVELRFRLESDLIGGAHSLHRLKHEIEANRQKLMPALAQAHQDLAQVEKDLKVASKRNPAWLIITGLVIAFFIGMRMSPPARSDIYAPYYGPDIKTPRDNGEQRPDNDDMDVRRAKLAMAKKAFEARQE